MSDHNARLVSRKVLQGMAGRGLFVAAGLDERVHKPVGKASQTLPLSPDGVVSKLDQTAATCLP